MVKGLTVKRTSLVKLPVKLVELEPLVKVPPPEVRVPALAFGELFGKSWSQTML